MGELRKQVLAMARQLHHRGPDDCGSWFDPAGGVGLGHRRLSIVDVSPAGHQPMVSASARYVLSYNGEIYNFEAIRAELRAAGRAPPWRGHSDTEVLLAAVEAWGIVKTLAKLVGMFALALWDRDQRALTLARDRLGEKPLYYGVAGGRLYFASEMKAIRAVAGDLLQVDRNALSTFMQLGYVPAPSSIYTGIFKLPPGHSVTVTGPGDAGQSRPFWRIGDGRADLMHELAGCGDDTLLDRLYGLLGDAVAGQMVSDVPLGAFLSGGVDSSLIVALMQQRSRRPVRTFTIGFAESGFDEAPFARAVAAHLGTDHTEMYLGPKDAADLIPSLPVIYDEPFADSSQIPTTLVARMTRRHVTVALSGDGGDELFAGYPRYQIVATLWRRIARLPLPLRSAAAALIAYPSPQTWDRLFSILPAARKRDINGRRMHRLSQLLGSRSLATMYIQLMSKWLPEDGLVLGVGANQGVSGVWDPDLDAIEAMRTWDVEVYLPDDLLVKVDRAAMSASLETRAPYLDHRVVELAMALPQRLLVRAGVGKWALRQLLDRHVPRQMIDRPKAGFEVPLGAWLRGPLRLWAESLLDRSTLAGQGFLDPRQVHSLWQQHLSGRFDRSLHLWNLLMFQAWLASAQSSPSLPAPVADRIAA